MQNVEEIDRLWAEVVELKSLVDEAKPIIEYFPARSMAQLEWRVRWLERARKALEGL